MQDENTKTNDKTDDIEITMKFRGEPTAIVRALVHGFPREALMDIHAALDREMAKRSVQRGERWPTDAERQAADADLVGSER